MNLFRRQFVGSPLLFATQHSRLVFSSTALAAQPATLPAQGVCRLCSLPATQLISLHSWSHSKRPAQQRCSPSATVETAAALSTQPRVSNGAPGAQDQLLERLVSSLGALPAQPKLQLAELPGGAGRGLVASQDAAAGEVLLSLPLESALVGAEHADAPWNVSMAVKLLRERYACKAASSGQASTSGGCKCPWIAALPPFVPLPWVHYSQAAITAIGDEDTIAEAQTQLRLLDEGFQGVKLELAALGYGFEDFKWAASVIYSRCFSLAASGVHVVVPGIDMANHSFAPTARVSMNHSPDACQGRDAVEEVCPPSPLAGARFELLAGDAGLAAGQEVTISYGQWPNNVFFLFYGFLPCCVNTHDSVVLFKDVAELVRCCGLDGVDVAAAQRCLGDASDWQRFVVSYEGVDGRLFEAWQALPWPAAVSQNPAALKVSFLRMVATRCAELERRLQEAEPSTCEKPDWHNQLPKAQHAAQSGAIASNAKLQPGVTSGSISVREQFEIVQQYRLGKRRVLLHARMHAEQELQPQLS